MASALVLVPSCAVSPVLVQHARSNGQWRASAADNGAVKYSSIDAGRIDRLQIAWKCPNVDHFDSRYRPEPRRRQRQPDDAVEVDGIVNAPDSRRTLPLGDRGSGLWKKGERNLSVTLLYEDPQTDSSVPGF